MVAEAVQAVEVMLYLWWDYQVGEVEAVSVHSLYSEHAIEVMLCQVRG